MKHWNKYCKNNSSLPCEEIAKPSLYFWYCVRSNIYYLFKFIKNEITTFALLVKDRSHALSFSDLILQRTQNSLNRFFFIVQHKALVLQTHVPDCMPSTSFVFQWHTANIAGCHCRSMFRYPQRHCSFLTWICISTEDGMKR